MVQKGKYIYGVIREGEKEFGPIGIGDQGDRVYTIPYRDISAVVSDSEIVDYTHMLRDALARQLVRHQKVIEGIMSLGHTIIPMRLGTFAQDEDEVRDILNKGYKVIKDIFRKISDKIEIDLAATWSDFNLVLREVGEGKEIKEFKEKLLTSSKGITVDDQMKIGVMVKQALDRKKEKFSQVIQEALKTVSLDFKTHGLMDDKMVINTAFLIEKSKREEFDKKVEELNTEFNERLNFRCVGPLPPYSFYTLEIKKLKFEGIDWARKKLKLPNNFATRDEIKKAHQAMAFSFHPDKNPDTPGIEKEFNEVSKAYEILWEYCRDESCSFNEQDFKKNSVLVRVRE